MGGSTDVRCAKSSKDGSGRSKCRRRRAMGTTDEAVMSRVISGDGTDIAIWTSGHGKPLILVHGAPADHTRWRPLLPHLEPHVTVHAIDRRGRGGSGDGPAYTL